MSARYLVLPHDGGLSVIEQLSHCLLHVATTAQHGSQDFCKFAKGHQVSLELKLRELCCCCSVSSVQVQEFYFTHSDSFFYFLDYGLMNRVE